MPPLPLRWLRNFTFLLVCCGMQLLAAAAEPARADAEFFERTIRPLLADHCWACHGPSGKPKGGLRLASRSDILTGGDSGAAAVAGDPGGSLLVKALRYDDDLKMPPKGKLKDSEIASLERWIALGLPWPEPANELPAKAAVNDAVGAADPRRLRFWSFEDVRPVNVSGVDHSSRFHSAIDYFVTMTLEKKGLALAPPADRLTLIRRATFDLIGLPPTPAEIDAFLADRSPMAFERVVDRLLASPHYGERWGRHWLDVVRYADARDLIQLPPESDFREAWRYRDWVVRSFNRDLSYPDFVRHQIAGDLLPPSGPGGINADGLVATGMLAIADFVPGDVDKETMIADYVNDQVDVVSKVFLGLSIACARCHDHKFDPISIDDYYALAGIFFSTRLIPGPVPGNTPLIRVPLLTETELNRLDKQAAADRRRKAEIEQQIADGADRAFIEVVDQALRNQLAAYLIAACELRQRTSDAPGSEMALRAQARGLDAERLARFVAYLEQVAAQPAINHHPTLRAAASGSLTGARLIQSAVELQGEIAAFIKHSKDLNRSSPDAALARSCLVHLSANDTHLLTDRESRITLWPNRASLPADAMLTTQARGPVLTKAIFNGYSRNVVFFDGNALLELPRKVPPAGSLFVVYRVAPENGNTGQRLIGWEDSDTGKHGLGLMIEPDGRLHAVVRKDGASGDLIDNHPERGFQMVSLTWGPRGTILHRNGAAAGSQTGIDGVSSDPAIAALRLGGPGLGASARFRGELATIRVFDRQLDDNERRRVEQELRTAWFEPADKKPSPRDPLSDLYDELRSAHGPLWPPGAETRKSLLSPSVRSHLDILRTELDELKRKPRHDTPRAVVVQEGGPTGTRHEGFKDALVFLRGNPKRPGKVVPRGVPRVLAKGGKPALPIKSGSGRQELAEWLVNPANPLTARVMVNRVWQHHFGLGLVPTPNDFGERGERPANPELLDWLATRFVESRWSIKALHKLIMQSFVYQQSSRALPKTIAADPENRLLGRMNRRRLDAEAIRDSLLVVSDRLDSRFGGPSLTDIAAPRRTIYFQTVRTGPAAHDFNRLFDRADPGSIVPVRGESTVAAQALFFLNDPFVQEVASALAARVLRDAPGKPRDRIRVLYALTVGRSPTPAELEVGLKMLGSSRGVDVLTQYCQLILCSNEFIYLE